MIHLLASLVLLATGTTPMGVELARTAVTTIDSDEMCQIRMSSASKLVVATARHSSARELSLRSFTPGQQLESKALFNLERAFTKCSQVKKMLQKAFNEGGYPQFLSRNFESYHARFALLGTAKALDEGHCPQNVFEMEWGEVQSTPTMLNIVTSEGAVMYLSNNPHDCITKVDEHYLGPVLGSMKMFSELLSLRIPIYTGSHRRY